MSVKQTEKSDVRVVGLAPGCAALVSVRDEQSHCVDDENKAFCSIPRSRRCHYLDQPLWNPVVFEAVSKRDFITMLHEWFDQ